MLYPRLAGLALTVDGYALEPLELATRSGWTRHSTVVRLRGGGHAGVGEDVVYGAEQQLAFQKHGGDLPLGGTYTLEEFSHRLDAFDLFPAPPGESFDRLYRRWAFESAALDLALRQAGRSLAGVLELEPEPVTFVVSLGLGEPASIEPIQKLGELYPDMRFKIDLSASWTEELVRELACTRAIATVDLKGQYHGNFKGPPPDAEMYRLIAELLPEAWIEDPFLNEATREALRGHEERITWDANLHSVADILQLPFEPRCINVKPSRFGLLSELLRVYEYCSARGIAMYGGGQFELGCGRSQLQLLASLFHPGAANDLAPSAFNERELRADLPASPLAPFAPFAKGAARTGLDWL